MTENLQINLRYTDTVFQNTDTEYRMDMKNTEQNTEYRYRPSSSRGRLKPLDNL